MTVLTELIHRLRSGEITFDEFLETAASMWVDRPRLAYPETDSSDAEAYRYGVSAATVSTARQMGLITSEEAEAIYAAIPATVN